MTERCGGLAQPHIQISIVALQTSDAGGNHNIRRLIAVARKDIVLPFCIQCLMQQRQPGVQQLQFRKLQVDQAYPFS